LRLSRQAPALEVLRGAARTLSSQTLRSVWARVAPGEEEALAALLGRHGLHPTGRSARSTSVQLVFQRNPPAALTLDDRTGGEGLQV
jgi:hypothetical protein